MNLGASYDLRIPDRLSIRYTYLLSFWQADMLTKSWTEILLKAKSELARI
jgi:hypothetical protein